VTNRTRRAVLAATLAAPIVARAQGVAFRIGLILPMTGPFASTDWPIDAAVKA
jgi:branched-chain amino acid transport system substrate-binding protein